MLLVVRFLGVDAFLPIWILFELEIYCYIYEIEQTYVKQLWRLSSFEVALNNRIISPETYSQPG